MINKFKFKDIFMKVIFNNKKGFSSIELIVTIIIAGIGLVGVISLMSKVVQASERSQTNLIAVNLAREGIEIVRNIRDSNWLAGNVWDKDLYSSTDYTAIAEYNVENNSFYLNFDINDINNERTRIFYDENTGIYSHNVTNTPTEFYRMISLDLICRNVNTGAETVRTSGQNCREEENKIGIQATSHLQIRGPVSTRNTILVDKFYNWR